MRRAGSKPTRCRTFRRDEDIELALEAATHGEGLVFSDGEIVARDGRIV